MSSAEIKKIFERLSPTEKKRAIVFVEGRTYTWEEIINIIEEDENSKVAKKIINKIEEIIK